MRSERAMKNSLISIITQILIVFLSFLNRKIFLAYLSVDYLGYEGLFTNIFNILNVTELGIGGIITFHLYRAFAQEDQHLISKLMVTYKWVYRCIAVIVTSLGLMLTFALPYVVRDSVTDWKYIYTIYFIQLAGTALNFAFSYNRTLFLSDQCEYITVIVDLLVKLVIQILQIIVIVIFRSFIIYLVIKSFCTVIANIIITILARRRYTFIDCHTKVSLKDVASWNIITDTKNFLVHKVAYIIYSGTDNILISMVCGIQTVALYGNYYLVYINVFNILVYKMLDPIQASIGNFLYSCQEKETVWNKFNILETVTSIMAFYVSCAFIVCFQPFIALWLGKQYLLPFSFVFVYSITAYITIRFEMLYKFRSTFGEYQKDKNYMILAAAINLSASIILGKEYGVVGIQLGTLLGILPIIWGRIRLVVAELMNRSISKYLLTHLINSIPDILTAIFLAYITQILPMNLQWFIIRVFILLTVCTFVNYVHYRKSTSFLALCSILSRNLKKFFHKMYGNQSGEK